MKDIFDIPDNKKIRVIVDTDAACEADDPFAIVHALLSPKLIVKGIIAEQFGVPGSTKKSFEEIKTILEAMNIEIPVYMGEESAIHTENCVQESILTENSDREVINCDMNNVQLSTECADSQTDKLCPASQGVEFIVREAMAEDDKPLFILCQGAITNVARALMQEPEIKGRMTVIWIGTHGEAPHEAPFREFNAGNDIYAANYVLQSGADIWLVPSTVYTTVHIGIAEIKRRIAPCGKIGAHLYQNLMDYNMSEGAFWTQGESWSLGDSPAIALAINPGCGRYKYAPAPYIAADTSSDPKAGGEDGSSAPSPNIRIYTDIDSRYVLEDLISKLELFTENQGNKEFIKD